MGAGALSPVSARIGRTAALAISLVLVWAGPALLWAGAATVTATNSTKIAPQGAATFGVQGTWQGSDPAPRSFTLNGTTCGTVT